MLYQLTHLQLARTHLLDEPGRSKNPLKKAMRRRNARRVDFANPTFYEASEVEWSDEETTADKDEISNAERPVSDTQDQQAGHSESGPLEGEEVDKDGAETRGQVIADEASTIRTQSTSRPGQEATRSIESGEMNTGQHNTSPRNLEEAVVLTSKADNTVRITKAGTIRNTDSFFGNEAEPRKISLTPNLLREESADGSARSSGSTDRTPAGQDAFEAVERSGADKTKDEKRKKDKKSGMLSGLFKRKDKKIKVDEAAGGTVIKHEAEPVSPISLSGESSPLSATPASTLNPQVRRSGSNGKLTKMPPAAAKSAEQANPAPADPAAITSPANGAPTMSREQGEHVNTTSIKSASPSLGNLGEPPLQLDTTASQLPPPDAGRASSPAVQSQSTNTSTQNEGPTRIPDSADMSQPNTVSPLHTTLEQQDAQRGATASTESSTRTVSPSTPIDSSSETVHSPEVSSNQLKTSSDGLSAADQAVAEGSTSKEPRWNDAALLAYLEQRSSQDARDLLLIVNDKTGVVPLPLDHPTMLGLGFHEHQRQLNDMSARLDGLLNGFLARKAARPKQSQR